MRYNTRKFLLHISNPVTIISFVITTGSCFLYEKKVISDHAITLILCISVPFWLTDGKRRFSKEEIKRAILVEEVLRKLLKAFK